MDELRMSITKLEFTQGMGQNAKPWSHCHAEFCIGMNFFVYEFIISGAPDTPDRFTKAEKKIGERLASSLFTAHHALQKLTATP